MQRFDWKSIAELIGIAAIVASLVFVGFQLRLDDRVARSALSQSEAASRAELAIGMSDHAETWEKANRCETLTPAEKTIIGSQVDSWFRRALMSSIDGRTIRGGDGGTSRAIFSIWLYQNPGARRIWEKQRTLEFEMLQHLEPDTKFINNFADNVRADMIKLDSVRGRSICGDTA